MTANGQGGDYRILKSELDTNMLKLRIFDTGDNPLESLRTADQTGNNICLIITGQAKEKICMGRISFLQH